MQSGWFALSAIRSGWSGIRKLNPRRNCAVVAQAHVCVANPSKWMSSLDYSPQVGQCLAQTPDALNLGQNRLRSVEWPRNGVEAPAMRCVRHVGARVGDALFTPACSSPPSIALRPCVAARSSMSGASSRATKGKHETQTRNAHLSPRAVRLRRLRSEWAAKVVGNEPVCFPFSWNDVSQD